MLTNAEPERARRLMRAAQEAAERRFARYEQIASQKTEESS